jgi:hypothetical protein
LFDDLCRRTPAPSGEVVVYGHSFPDWFARAARAWAGANGARLVSLGYRNAWADEQRLAAGPEDFAQAIADAAAVITNFFHGCVFALVNDRPFACAISDYRANKVSALAAALGVERRLISPQDPSQSLAQALAARPGPQVAGRLGAMRRQSEGYLEQALA